ncbi:MAG TPA: hypothetical protein VJT09_00800 [Pyrinomonadaceae bacterium]|nr:hypothetical protein [Pyrinomonadaceae bacterium]
MNNRKVLVFLCSCLLAAGCGQAGSTNNSSSSRSTVTTNTTTTSTTNAGASPKANTEAAKPATETAAPGTKLSKPEEAAEGLFNAWKRKDRDEAAKFAVNAAIAELFVQGGGGPEGMQFQGCDKQGDSYLCGYYYEGGGLIMNVEENQATGYKVTSVAFIAD